jgi:glycerol-3-phosphate dehydrogenase (NAD(P)+)
VTANSVGVVGGGAWGTALAQTARLAGREALLWAHEAEVVAEINAVHVNSAFLPGIALHPALRATANLAELAACDVVLMVAPAQHLRSVAAALAPHLAKGKPVVVCAKGIEQASGKLLLDVIREVLPAAEPAILSGPSFAIDVARGLPAAVTVATAQETLGRALAQSLAYRQFRIYWSSDTIGVQLGGAVKNVLAIAAGIVLGRRLGDSAHAALLTRGFAELRRFGAALGARRETLVGLSGLGDLMLTCSSPQSRNMSLGLALGEGEKLAAVLASRRSVAEGVFTARAVVRLAAARGIEMPICEAVDAILEGRRDIDTAIGALLSRPLRAED